MEESKMKEIVEALKEANNHLGEFEKFVLKAINIAIVIGVDNFENMGGEAKNLAREIKCKLSRFN